MKTKLIIIGAVAILVSSCTTGTYMARTYDDDIYFSPGDVPPVSIMENDVSPTEKSARINNSDARNQRIIMSQMDKNPDGSSSVNNYIYQPDGNNDYIDSQSYNMDNQDLAESDTTVYYNDDDVKYVINNYYDDNDNNIDFAYRINRFHRPYYYDPFFYDDWSYGGYYGGYYSPFYSGYYGMGYNSWYGGWGYPYSYYGYYSPFSLGFGGYWGGGYGGYYGYGGYNNGYYGYGGSGGYYNNNSQVARRRATNMNVPGGGYSNNNAITGSRSSTLRSANTQNSTGIQTGDRTAPNSWTENGHVRSRSINSTGNTQDTKNATLVNDRRSSTSVDGRRSNSTTGNQVQSNDVRTPQMVRPGTNNSGNVRRSYQPSTTGRTYNQGNATTRQSQNYTPSYNKPRVVNQSNYNNNSYTRPRTTEGSTRTVVKSANTNGSGQSYSAPRSSSSVRQTYRSSSSYSSGSSSSGTRSTQSYSAPSRSSSNYSAPSSSGSSGRSSSGSSSSGSSSSGSSSSGSSGGGSGHRR